MNPRPRSNITVHVLRACANRLATFHTWHSQSDSRAFLLLLDTYATRLSARHLSLHDVRVADRTVLRCLVLLVAPLASFALFLDLFPFREGALLPRVTAHPGWCRRWFSATIAQW
jgi:hypothetical protein